MKNTWLLTNLLGAVQAQEEGCFTLLGQSIGQLIMAYPTVQDMVN